MIGWSHTRTGSLTDAFSVDDDLKPQVRITTNSEDKLLATYLRVAERTIESELGIALLPQTWVLKLDDFPAYAIRLPTPPLRSVTSIVYVDPEGASQTLASGQYVIHQQAHGLADSNPGMVRPANNVSWPSIRREPLPVTITYSAGFADAASIPEILKVAVLQTAADLYEHRERSSPEGGSLRFRQTQMYGRLVDEYRRTWEATY